MILKKAFATFSCFSVSAVLLSQVYSFAQSRLNQPTLDLSAFTNLKSNIQSVAASRIESENISKEENSQVTADIIKVINKELSKDIRVTKYAVIPHRHKVDKTVIAKVEKKEIQTVIKNEDLSAFEIDNKSLIELFAFDVDRIEYSTFENTQLASTYEEIKEVKDEVAMKVASTENNEQIATAAPIEADEVKTIQPAPTTKADDDLVMYEYSDKVADAPKAEQDIDAKLYDRPISNAVKRAITREIGQAPIKKLEPVTTHKTIESENKTTIDDQEIDLNSDDNIVYDYTSNKASSAKSESEAFTASPQVNTQETKFIVRAKELNLNTHKLTQLSGFEFVPDYDRGERVSDSSTGEISFEYSLSGNVNTQTGVLQAQGIIPTRVELALGAMKGLEVPLLNEEGIQKFLQKQGLNIEGNLLMIALNSNIIDTEIDSNFGAKIILDKNFQPLQQMNGASFVLYAGVKTGNILLKYLLSNKETAQKIVYVGDGEMYFEDPSFTPSERETFTFTTRNLLGQKKKELTIDGEAISFFNTNTTAKKKALNAYEIKIPTLVTGMRKYLEFKHLKDSIFVGTNDEKDVEVPGNDFIAKVLEVNQVNSLKERCVVQINLSKDVSAITANGKNQSGEMFVETSFLDRDGNFTRESAELADKAFILGDQEGQFSVKLDYTDGSSQFLKTFCSEGTYLVEQL